MRQGETERKRGWRERDWSTGSGRAGVEEGEKGGGGEDYEGEDEGRERMEEEIKGREVGDQTQMLFVITVCNQCVSIILSHDACYPSKIHCHHN